MKKKTRDEKITVYLFYHENFRLLVYSENQAEKIFICQLKKI